MRLIAKQRKGERECEREKLLQQWFHAVLGSVLLTLGVWREWEWGINWTNVRLQDMSHFSTLTVMVSINPADSQSPLHIYVCYTQRNKWREKASPAVLRCMPVNSNNSERASRWDRKFTELKPRDTQLKILKNCLLLLEMKKIFFKSILQRKKYKK